MNHATLPELPYAADALEPWYDATTVALHHDKHHAGYVAGYNATLDKLAAARSSGDYGAITALERLLAFHGAGHVLHSVFWTNLKAGGGGRPSGHLAAAIERDFGSFEALDGQLRAAAGGVQGSGWGVLAAEAGSGSLAVLAVENHQHQLLPGWVPVLALDVWEHAYYLKYQNRRAEWIAAVMEHLIDWDDVARRWAVVITA